MSAHALIREARTARWLTFTDPVMVLEVSYRLRARVATRSGDAARALFEAMIAREPNGFGAFIDTAAWAVCSASHELFFARCGRRLTSRPMKGTAARGATAEDDAHQAAWLERSVKNRAENLMITDMVRNDIGRLADVGSVRTESLFNLEAHPTLWQLTSTVRGDTDATLDRIFAALETLLWAPRDGFRLLADHFERLAATCRYFFGRSVAERILRQRF